MQTGWCSANRTQAGVVQTWPGWRSAYLSTVELSASVEPTTDRKCDLDSALGDGLPEQVCSTPEHRSAHCREQRRAVEMRLQIGIALCGEARKMKQAHTNTCRTAAAAPDLQPRCCSPRRSGKDRPRCEPLEIWRCTHTARI